MSVDNRSAYSQINIKFQILFSTRKFFWRKYSAISRTPYLGEIWPVLSLICCKNRSAYKWINTVITLVLVLRHSTENHSNRWPSAGLVMLVSHLRTSIVCTVVHNYLVYFAKLAKVLWSLKKLQENTRYLQLLLEEFGVALYIVLLLVSFSIT